MKMNQNHNFFSFLSRGVTTTHPWCSVFIICLCFVFCASLVSASASQSNIPEMTDWQFQQAIDAYADLTDDQKDIANFLTGSQGYAFAGIAQSNLNTNFSSYNDTLNSVKSFGAKIWNELSNIDRSAEEALYKRREQLQGVKNDLSNFLGNAVTYAKSRSESFSVWLGNVGIDYNSTSDFRIQFGKDQAQNNVDYFGDQGLYNWQFSSNIIYPSDFDFVFNDVTLSGNLNQTYYNNIATLSAPLVKVNYKDNTRKKFVSSSILFSTYCYIFANLSNRTVYFCDANGNQAPTTLGLQGYYYSVSSNNISFANTNVIAHTLSLDLYNSILDLFNALNFQPSLLLSIGSLSDTSSFCFSDFVQGLYYGNSWESKSVWQADFDLNLTSTSQYVTINAPVNTIYIDINGFMRDLYDNPTIIYNYVINNSIDGNGDSVDPSIFEPVSKFPSIPDSGITIGTEFFKINGLNPLFGSGGYIDALWNNTKGLVLYIGDIFNVLTLDSIDGGGFAWVIYGAVSVGVIGGIFSKFLL